MLFDTHCHLDACEFDADREAVVAAAVGNGVRGMLVPSVAPTNFAAVRACSERYPGCFPAYGIHPLYVDAVQKDALDVLRQWLASEAAGAHPPVAVGEIGLDFYLPQVNVGVQEFYFREQLGIAAALSLPVLLHVRRAVDAVLKHLRQVKVRGGIAHAFNGSREQADAFIALGFCLGFGGAMTYPGSLRIRRLAASLPLEAIVLETDAPDIPPVWLRGGVGNVRNTPEQLPKIAAVLAALRGEPVEKIVEICSENANRCVPTMP